MTDAPVLAWRWLGRVTHAAAMDVQETARARVLDGDDAAQVLLLAEHHPTVTIGRNADESHLRVDRAALEARGVCVVHTTRGGDVTYHGPGQLMVYPVVRLRSGLVAFLEAVAMGLAEVAASLGVPGAVWQRDPAGLWLRGAKLAACGVHLRRRVTTHGFALDVSTPPEAWQVIDPCGMPGLATVSIAAVRASQGLSETPSVEQVARRAAPILCRVLDSVRARGLPSPT